MCRIAGFASLNILPHRETTLEAVAHGGPDDAGTYLDKCVALGHRRLSIIDLSSAGHQPMFLDEELIISFNGEIYNFLILKKELEVLGATFKTQTDTEVILHAYRQWGTAAFDCLEGIFAFALYDKTKRKLMLVRDHIGVKPLYYHFANNQLVFGSEVRIFNEFKPDWKENENWKILFLAFGSVPHPHTTLEGVYQLNPGYLMEINLDDFSYEVHQYAQLKNKKTAVNAKEELEAVGKAVYAAVKKNLISDAPLGIFLGGGIDSSLLTLLADQFQEGIKTLSVNFDEASFDEYPFQKQVLKKTKNADHISYRVSEHKFWECLPDIWRAMDQPTIDGVNSYFISRCAKSYGLKAVLSGLGADEIFGGYASFKRVKWIGRFRSLFPFKYALAKILSFRKHAYRRLMYLDLPGPVGDYLFLRGIHTPDDIASLLGATESEVWQTLNKVKVTLPVTSDEKERVSLLELKIYLTNQLLKDTDCMGMWHGLEIRTPFLDVGLIRAMNSISTAVKYKHPGTKYLLTRPFEEILPPAIATRVKKGFTFPISTWINSEKTKFIEMTDGNQTVYRIVDRLGQGNIHWSKCWSLAVMKQFLIKQNES